MNKEHHVDILPNTRSKETLKISAKIAQNQKNRISQGDIFEDVFIIENLQIHNSKIKIDHIKFPYIVCLNQECDLETDSCRNSEKLGDNCLLHLAIAPAFNFDQFLLGTHWGRIFGPNNPQKRADTVTGTRYRNGTNFLLKTQVTGTRYRNGTNFLLKTKTP